jgi:hypothetical protein
LPKDQSVVGSELIAKSFTSEGIRTAYFLLQLKYVAWLITASRQISATGTPSSPRFTMNAFCASENSMPSSIPFLPS